MKIDNSVIAVSSAPGGDKTTLVDKTTKFLSASTLFFDDYVKPPDYPKDIPAWLENGLDPNVLKSPGFSDALSVLKQDNAVVSPNDGVTIAPSDFIIIEEPMGRERADDGVFGIPAASPNETKVHIQFSVKARHEQEEKRQ